MKSYRTFQITTVFIDSNNLFHWNHCLLLCCFLYDSANCKTCKHHVITHGNNASQTTQSLHCYQRQSTKLLVNTNTYPMDPSFRTRSNGVKKKWYNAYKHPQTAASAKILKSVCRIALVFKKMSTSSGVISTRTLSWVELLFDKIWLTEWLPINPPTETDPSKKFSTGMTKVFISNPVRLFNPSIVRSLQRLGGSLHTTKLPAVQTAQGIKIILLNLLKDNLLLVSTVLHGGPFFQVEISLWKEKHSKNIFYSEKKIFSQNFCFENNFF